MLKKLKSIYWELYRAFNYWIAFTKVKKRGRTKYFCIGSNKTGSTSLERMFNDLGYIVGDQRQAELLVKSSLDGDLEPLIKYCKTAEVFQDVPFSFLEIYKDLDNKFINSKFILTIRDNSEQWYDSLINFHSKLFNGGVTPTWEILKNNDYVYKGWLYSNKVKVFGLTEKDDPYDKQILTEYYNKRNNNIIEYFKERPNDLLVINLSIADDYSRFCNFIGVENVDGTFPWENKTDELKKIS